MKNMDFDFFIEPNFFSWPLPSNVKRVFYNEKTWPKFFSNEPMALSLFLNSISLNIKRINFSNHVSETNLFFRFLSTLVKSKPQDDRVLQAFNNIIAEIVVKLSFSPHFNKKQEKVVHHYLKLLSLMLEPSYRYWFEKLQISLWMDDFEKISTVSFYSSALLSQFRNTLLLSFQSRTFIKKYPPLIRVICKLACSLDKARADTPELEAMKLFDTLGVLDFTLKTSQVERIVINQVKINQSIQEARNLIYKEFEPYIEENFLKFIFFKTYLTQSYANTTNLTELCDSKQYQTQCKSDYLRYKESHRCLMAQFPRFWITIKHNNYPKLKLNKWCAAMRNVEFFIVWMDQNFGLQPNYKASQYTLYLSDFKKNFLMDKFLWERDDLDLAEQPHTMLTAYFRSKTSQQTNSLVGSTYAYTTHPSDLAHRYLYHLCTLYIKNSKLNLTLTEGLAELHSRGMCSKRNIADLRVFINDTFIFELFKRRQYPFYFNAFKWVAYLVDEQPQLLKKWLAIFQNKNNESFYLTIDNFIQNVSNIESFVDWSRQHVKLCNKYLNRFDEGHQPPKIYLADIQQTLNQTRMTHALNLRNNFSQQTNHFHEMFHEKNLTFPDVRMAKREIREFNPELEWSFFLPLGSLLTGFIFSFFDDLSLKYRDKHSFFTFSLDFGFKPFVCALVSADLNVLLFDPKQRLEEKINNFLLYFFWNFSSVFLGQSLNKKLTESIQNKLLCFFMQMLTWTLLWNPSFFFLKDRQLFLTLLMQLAQGFSFKLGEEGYRHGKNIFWAPGFWSKKTQPIVIEDNILSHDTKTSTKPLAAGI